MFNITGLRDEEIALFENHYNKISAEYDITINDGIEFHIDEYFLTKDYRSIAIQESLYFKNTIHETSLSIFQVEYAVQERHTTSVIEFQPWASIIIPIDAGHILLRKETLKDKLTEFFQPLELDIDSDEDFSNQFYVLAKDEKKAFRFLNDQCRNILLDFVNFSFQLEVFKNRILITENKCLGKCDDRRLADMVNQLGNIRFI